MQKPSTNTRLLYALLGLYIVVSMTYYAANIAGFVDDYFDLHHRPEAPFNFDIDSLKITTVRPEAKNAGLDPGDTLDTVEGKPFPGEADWLTMIRSGLHPGDPLPITVRQPDGRYRSVDIHLAGQNRASASSFSEWGGIMSLYGLTYNVATRELVYVNAGHNAPFLVRQAGDQFQVQRLEAGGPVVGLLSFATYEEQRLVLEPGDLLLTYTDGISEAMTVDDEEWGEERMLAAAQTQHDGTAQEVLEHLFAEADRFTGKAPQHDDMTLLVLKLQDEPKPPVQ